MNARLKRGLRIVASILALPALGVGGFVIYIAATDNLHEVSAGRIYRSAQMSGDTLARVIQERGIKTIVNLRGDNPDAGWYQAEISTAKKLGVQHYDFSLSASREVSDDEMERILAILDRAPKPLLLHCKNGADRSGLAGALYLYGLEGKPAEAADKQLTILCGHVPYLFWRDTVAMDRSFWRYVSNHIQNPNPSAAGSSTP
jgi:protein tyrosine phosphatase (PTP) superfamily phosphohydrolase (DUF442 family)